MEESVRRRRLMWSWEHISKHRKISREYIAIWRKKLYGDKLSQAQLANLEVKIAQKADPILSLKLIYILIAFSSSEFIILSDQFLQI